MVMSNHFFQFAQILGNHHPIETLPLQKNGFFRVPDMDQCEAGGLVIEKSTKKTQVKSYMSPPKTNMSMEQTLFEDVFPMEYGHLPMSC